MQTISHRAAHTVLEDVSLRPSPQGQLYTFLPTCIIFSFSDVFSLLGSFLQVLEIFYAVSGSHRVPRWLPFCGLVTGSLPTCPSAAGQSGVPRKLSSVLSSSTGC